MQNLVKSKFPYIDMFDHKVPDMIRVMRYLTVGVFEHIYITSVTDVDIRIKYIEHILRGPSLNKY